MARSNNMGYDHRKQQHLNQKHVIDPQRGDYWNEMLVGTCVVLSRVGDRVIVCKIKKPVDNNHWTWDLDQIEMMKIEQFKDWLTYDSISNKTWANVCPNHHLDFVEQWESDNESKSS